MKEFIKSFLSKNGDISSKRIFTMWLMLDLSVYIFLPEPNPIIAGSLLSAIMGIIIGQVVTKT
jgi:hypothetical protein